MGTLASSEEAIILVPEESTAATTRCSLKTQVTRTASLFKEIPQLITIGELSSAHHFVKTLFCNFKIATVPLAGRLLHFISSSEKPTKDKNILKIVKGYRIPFLSDQN